MCTEGKRGETECRSMNGIGARDVGENVRWREKGMDCGESERLDGVNTVAYTHTYIHAYIHAYINTYIHTHIHTLFTYTHYLHTYMHT